MQVGASTENFFAFKDKVRQKIKAYLALSKSGIVTLVIISVLGGYLIGQPPDVSIDGWNLLATLLGVFFLSAGSSGFNQYQDREMDALMPRTQSRPLPSGLLSINEVKAIVAVQIALGFWLLSRVGTEVVALGLIALITYNGFYTLWWKRRWAYAAVPGAIPGALPILIGHVAANRNIQSPAGIFLFALLFFWQMPHFWVLALKYRNDYEKGGIPTLPVIWGNKVTVFQIILWCLGYFGIFLAAPFFLRVRWIYWLVTIPVTGKVLYELKKFSQEPESKRWLSFFLWVNFSLIAFLLGAVLDLWSMHLLTPLIIR